MQSLKPNDRKSHGRRLKTVLNKANDLSRRLPDEDVRVFMIIQVNGSVTHYNSHPDQDEFWYLTNAELKKLDAKIYTPLHFVTGADVLTYDCSTAVTEGLNSSMCSSDDGDEGHQESRMTPRTSLAIPQQLQDPITPRSFSPHHYIKRSKSAVSSTRRSSVSVRDISPSPAGRGRPVRDMNLTDRLMSRRPSITAAPIDDVTASVNHLDDHFPFTASVIGLESSQSHDFGRGQGHQFGNLGAVMPSAEKKRKLS